MKIADMAEKRLSSEVRNFVANRAGHCCEYCRSQEKFAVQSFSMEHIIPLSKGGKTKPENLAFACQGCNAHKYNKVEGIDPVTENSVALFHPRRQKWKDHFKWSADFASIIGITPSGRATVEALKLNRKGLVNLRKVLLAMGEHPPEE